MRETGRYGDGRTYELPDGWPRVSEEVLGVALGQVTSALGGDAAGRLAAYYDREGAYAGTLFLDVEPHEPDVVTPADLYAVTTLGMTLDPRHGRLLLDDGPVRADVRRQLRGLGPTLPITALEHGEGGSTEVLQRTWELWSTFRTLLGDGSDGGATAAGLCARKRPYLFPVRDHHVGAHLGLPGDFRTDLQVHAFVVSTPGVVASLSWLRGELEGTGTRVDHSDLRLLGGALAMAAEGAEAGDVSG